MQSTPTFCVLHIFLRNYFFPHQCIQLLFSRSSFSHPFAPDCNKRVVLHLSSYKYKCKALASETLDFLFSAKGYNKVCHTLHYCVRCVTTPTPAHAHTKTTTHTHTEQVDVHYLSDRLPSFLAKHLIPSISNGQNYCKPRPPLPSTPHPPSRKRF